jgi:spermidine/putrescine transport system permease protein
VVRKSRAASKALKLTYVALVLAFLYLPIAVMIALSFNSSVSRAEWTGFTFNWYLELLHSEEIIAALQVTLEVAVMATIISTVIGTLGAIGMHAMKKGWADLLVNVSYLPMTTPDIVTGVSLMLMFVFMKVPLGKSTMLMAHIAFDTPYVLFSVMPRLKQMNPNLYEAALDLGCHPMKALFKVILPEIMPGVVTGSLLAFTMSLDDFVISYFTSNTDQNLAMIVYSAARRGVEPTMYALSALMFLCILVLLLIVNRRSGLEIL